MIHNAALTYTFSLILALVHNTPSTSTTADSLEHYAQTGMRNTHGAQRYAYATLDTLISLKYATPALFTVAQTFLMAYTHVIQTHTRKAPAQEPLELPLYSARYESSSASPSD